MQRSKHYNAWYCAWKACEKLEGLLALSQAIWPAGQEWESGLQEETQEVGRVRKSRGKVDHLPMSKGKYFVRTKKEACQLLTSLMLTFYLQLWIQAMVTPNLRGNQLSVKMHSDGYDVWIKLLCKKKQKAKMNVLLVGLRGSCWRKDLIPLPLKRRGLMWGGANQMEGHEGMGKDVQLTQSAW